MPPPGSAGSWTTSSSWPTTWARDLVVLHRDRSFFAEDCSTTGHFGTGHFGVRHLRVRSGDQCEYPGCTNRLFLQKAHVKTPKAGGGGQEVGDLADLCSQHHGMHDAGRFHLLAWTRDLRPIFRRREGEILWPQGSLEPPARPRGAGEADGAGEVRDRPWFVRVGPTSRRRPCARRRAPPSH